MVAGALLLADAAMTLLWQEPISAAYAAITQSELSGQLHRLETRPPSSLQKRALRALGTPQRRIAFMARVARRDARTGQAIGRIEIPRIGADYVVVQGTDTGSLRKGPGHYPHTSFPGLAGTAAIAGHRTTYLAPFRHVDALRPGDRIVLAMPYARLTYRVQTSRTVLPTDTQVTRDVGYKRLVLSACTPLYSASHRIVVFARQVSARPRGAAQRA
jgi:sortase A